jgi:hypothetical protein
VAELIVVAAVVGVIVVAVWAIVGASARRRSPHDQPDVTDTRPVPPVEPDAPVPGSRPHRRAQGKP